MNEEKLSTKTKVELVIETGLQLIPYVGGSLASAYFGTKQARQYQRLERFYKELAEEINEIKEKIIPFDNQDIDSLVSLIEQVNDNIEREHQQVKIKFYKSYMKGLLLEPINKLNYDEKRVFLDAINSLSIIECDILILLYTKYLYRDVIVRSLIKSNDTEYHTIGAVNRLKAHGFISSSQKGFILGEVDAAAFNESISLNNYGKRFVEFALI